MITLKPLKKDQFGCLRRAFELRVEESNLTGRVSVDDLFRKLENGYDTRCMGAYVDNTENPQHVLVMGHFPGFLTQGTFASVILIYSLPEARGDTGAVDVMATTAENYARLNGCATLIGSSWVLDGARPIDALWKHYGFREQERIYIKNLT